MLDIIGVVIGFFAVDSNLFLRLENFQPCLLAFELWQNDSALLIILLLFWGLHNYG